MLVPFGGAAGETIPYFFYNKDDEPDWIVPQVETPATAGQAQPGDLMLPPESLLQMAQQHAKMGTQAGRESCRYLLHELLRRHPDSPEAKKAGEMLSSMPLPDPMLEQYKTAPIPTKPEMVRPQNVPAKPVVSEKAENAI